jgi:hypothetical protein
MADGKGEADARRRDLITRSLTIFASSQVGHLDRSKAASLLNTLTQIPLFKVRSTRSGVTDSLSTVWIASSRSTL